MNNPTFQRYTHSYPSVKEDVEILFIGMSDEKVISVITDDTFYNFDWCKRDERYYHHDSGSGIAGRPVTIYPGETNWISDRIAVECTGEFTRLSSPPMIDMIIDQLESMEEHSVNYCSICDDYLPDEEPCQHIVWCDECCMFSAPEPEEQCEHYTALAEVK
jgi:hypothetical protein